MIRLDNNERQLLLSQLLNVNSADKLAQELRVELKRLKILPYKDPYDTQGARNFIDEICGDHPLISLAREYYGSLSPCLLSEGTSNREFFEDVSMKTREVRDLEVVLDERAASLFTRNAIREKTQDELKGKIVHYHYGLIIRLLLCGEFGLIDHRLYTAQSMLGYDEVNHHAYEEFGLSLSKNLDFPDFIKDAAIQLNIRRITDNHASGVVDDHRDGLNLSDYLNVTASFPRGKNTGLPWMASGGERLVNDLVMAVDAALASALVSGYPIDRMFQGLVTDYVVFSRYQRTGKSVPFHFQGQTFESKFLESRRRIINSTPKPIAMAIKPLMKWLTVHSINAPEFSQDRKKIRARVKGASVVEAYDASRFDLRSGGTKLKSGIEAISLIARHFHDYPVTVDDLMMREAFLPTFVDDGLTKLIFRESDKSALRSGASTTSRVGSLMNLMYDMFVTSKAENFSDSKSLVDYYITHEPSCILGDDLIKFFPDEGAWMRYTQALPHLDDIGMKIDPEEPTKFLGYLIYPPENYAADGTLKVKTNRDLYHSASPLDNVLFPERYKTNSTASFLSRILYITLNRADVVLDAVQKMMTDKSYLMERFQEFHSRVMPYIRPFYEAHPNNRAYQFFASFPDVNENAEIVSKNLFESIDSILYDIGKGSELDVNWKVVGVPALDELNDESIIKGTLADLSWRNNNDQDSIAENWRNDVINMKPREREFVRQVLTALSSQSYEEFVRAWKAIMPAVSRRITTPKGDIFVTSF